MRTRRKGTAACEEKKSLKSSMSTGFLSHSNFVVNYVIKAIFIAVGRCVNDGEIRGIDKSDEVGQRGLLSVPKHNSGVALLRKLLNLKNSKSFEESGTLMSRKSRRLSKYSFNSYSISGAAPKCPKKWNHTKVFK